MTDVVAIAALFLAWFTFRYERHRRWRDAVDAAHGSLRAVRLGMLEGVGVGPSGESVGWGQLYFRNGYTENDADRRAAETADIIRRGGINDVFVVPAEPLAKLATAAPHDGLIAFETIAAANFALWRVRVFNQLVTQFTDFNSIHAAEIVFPPDKPAEMIPSSDEPVEIVSTTDEERREQIAKAGFVLSKILHRDGIGQSWMLDDGVGRGWFGLFVDALERNTKHLENERKRHLRRYFTEKFIAVDAFLIGAVVALALIAVL